MFNLPNKYPKDPSVDFTILKYANRKLYNKQTANYINYGDVINLVKTGATVKIIDYRTGADITAFSLVSCYMQIVKPDLMNRSIDELRLVVKAAKEKKDSEKQALELERAAFTRKLLGLEPINNDQSNGTN